MGREDAEYKYSKNSEEAEWDKQYEDSEEESSSSGSGGSGESYEEIKLTLAQACGLNTMNMFGTGPFITIPFVVAAADPPGPHALIGYAMAAFACMNDALVWSELGSIWPDSGGSYVYLRELYGPNTWGRLCAFIFVWQIMVSGPMEAASGFIATAQYIAYIDETYTYIHHSGIAFGMCVTTIWALYREIDEVGTITLVLWAFTIAAIIFTMIAGFISFKTEYIDTPADAYSDGGKFFVSMAVAARYAVYDFTGYYDVNFVGKEVKNPRETIPIACIGTCCVIAMCFFLVDIAVIGSLEWDPKADPPGYVELVTSGAESANFIMAIFCEKMISRNFAIFFSLIVSITIFGSCFSFIIGLAQVPYTAAKDGYFYDFLAHQHEYYKGLSDYSLLFVGALSTIFCFVELEIVIEGMLTMMLFVQFMGQGWGLIYYRYFFPEEDQEHGGFTVPMFPIPNIIQLIIFGFIFITTDTWIIGGHVPLLEIAILFLIAGTLMYLLWAKNKSFWPFAKEYNEAEEGLDHQFVFYDDYEEEMVALKKKLSKADKEIRKWNRKTASASMSMKKTDEQIREQILELGKQEFEVISLNRKIIDVEVKITDLYAMMSDQEKLLTETKIDNSDLRDKIYKIQGHVQDVWPHDTGDEYTPGTKYNGTDEAPTQSVTDWSVEDVYLWWRVALPRGAQRYIELVKECQLTGKDLLGVDEEMLAQFGMVKVLIHQVLKQIGHLKKIALNENEEYEGTNKSPRSKSKDRKADPSRDSRAYQQGSKDRGRSGDYGYEDDRPSRARSTDRRSRDRRR
jgi:amino acid transporter